MNTRLTTLPAACRRILSRLLRPAPVEGGNAAVEFALVAPILSIMMLNAVDFSFMVWDQMEVNNAAEVGAQVAYATCSPGTMPATNNCPGSFCNCPNLNSAVASAVASTTLGTNVTLVSNSPTEWFSCNTAGNGLTSIGGPYYQSASSATAAPASLPANCAAAGAAYAGNTPGDYVQVQVNYTYQPLFGGLSLVSSHTLTGLGQQRLQ